MIGDEVSRFFFFEPVPMSPAETAAYIAAERKRWTAVARAHNIKVE